MINNKKYEGAIFDLDGVLVDTAKYHYLAWKKLSDELGIRFDENDNERFKGVSRLACMDILCVLGDLNLKKDVRIDLASKKNEWYLDYISSMGQDEIFPGIEEVLKALKKKNIKIALGSASKNATFILERLGIADYFDAIIDGNSVSKAKPDPEVFLLAAKEINVDPSNCVVFEDAYAGVEAANVGGMMSVGIGKADVLYNAGHILDSPLKINELLNWF